MPSIQSASPETKPTEARARRAQIDSEATLQPLHRTNVRGYETGLGAGGSVEGSGLSTAHPLAVLHQTVGNQAVLRHLAAAQPRVQTKLTVNQPGDQYEQEADRVAERVMRMPEPHAAASVSLNANGLQRECSCGGSCDKCQAEHQDEQHGHFQMKPSTSVSAGPTLASPVVNGILNSPGQPLDMSIRAFMEPRFGQDFSRVRVHADTQAAESARTMQARAYTVGDDVVFGVGQFAPSSSQGRKLLAHELAHVVQQSGGASAVQRALDTEYEPVVLGRSKSTKSNANVLRVTKTREIVTDKLLAAWAAQHLREGRSVQWLMQNLLSSHEFEGSKDARESALDGLAFLLQEPSLRRALDAGEELKRARADEWRLHREAVRREYIERGRRVAPKGAELIMPEKLKDIEVSGGCSYVYPEICAGAAAGDYEIIGFSGGFNVIIRKLKMFYYSMGADDFHRNIGRFGMYASHVWWGTKGILYVGAAAAQKAGQIGRLVANHPLAQIGFRALEKAGSEGLEELDRMEAVRQGYEPHEKTELEKMEETLDYLDPTGLTPEPKIPQGRDTHPSTQGESSAHVGRSGTVHEEGRAGETSFGVGHEEATGTSSPETPGRDVMMENAVQESARKAGSELKLDDETHAVAAYGKGKEAEIRFCSEPYCSILRDKMATLLEALPKGYDGAMVRDLRYLRLRIQGIENDLKAGRLTEKMANTFSHEITRELESYAQRDRNIRKLLKRSEADLRANRAQISKELEGTTLTESAPRPRTRPGTRGTAGTRAGRTYHISPESKLAESQRGYQFYVYRNAKGEPLYVGKSGGEAGQKPMNWSDRLKQEHIETEWIGEARTVDVISELTFREAFALEEEMIPFAKYNKKPGEYSSRAPQGNVSVEAAAAGRHGARHRFNLAVMF